MASLGGCGLILILLVAMKPIICKSIQLVSTVTKTDVYMLTLPK